MAKGAEDVFTVEAQTTLRGTAQSWIRLWKRGGGMEVTKEVTKEGGRARADGKDKTLDGRIREDGKEVDTKADTKAVAKVDTRADTEDKAKEHMDLKHLAQCWNRHRACQATIKINTTIGHALDARRKA